MLAAGYLDSGLDPGDRIASLMPNRYELIVHYLAASRRAWSRRRSTTVHGDRDRPRPGHSEHGCSWLTSSARQIWRRASGLRGFRWARSVSGAGARRRCVPGAAQPRPTRRGTPCPRADRSRGHLLHVGQHRPAEGRDAHARDPRLDVRDAAAGLEFGPGDLVLGRVVALPRRRLHMSFGALRRARASPSLERSTGTSCCRCYATIARPCSRCCPRHCSR